VASGAGRGGWPPSSPIATEGDPIWWLGTLRSFSQSFHLGPLHTTRPNQPDDTPNLTCKDGTGRQVVDGGEATRNRKVEGSNPSSGSITEGQRASLALLTA
jgi:hypothetical protein